MPPASALPLATCTCSSGPCGHWYDLVCPDSQLTLGTSSILTQDPIHNIKQLRRDNKKRIHKNQINHATSYCHHTIHQQMYYVLINAPR